MEATEILMSEHRVIEHVLQALEIAARHLAQGGPVRPGFFVDASDFIKGFADGCHHQKEEGVLFKALIENGMPMKGGPVAVMLYEHEQGRAFTRAMRQAAQLLETDPSARDSVVQNTLGYVSLLRQHIQKEDGVLFPMADRLLPPDAQQKLTEGFEHIEHEETGQSVHEKYLALAEALEREATYLVTEA